MRLFALVLAMISLSVAAAPPAPTNVRAIGRNGEVLLAWDAVPEAAAYVVAHATATAGPYEPVGDPVAEPHCIVPKMANDVRHYFNVAVADGPASAVVSALPFALWPEGDEWPYTYRTTVKDQHSFFHLWLPPHTAVVKGVFAFTYHGCGGPLAELADMRYLAAALDCAIVGMGGETTKRGFSPSQILWDAVADLGRQSGHPEIVNAPIFTFGHSNGTGFAAGFANQEPGRVIGWIAFKSANGKQFSYPPIYTIPGLVLSGEQDKSYFNNQLDTVQRLRREHNAMMGMIVEPGAGHGPAGTKSYTICLAYMRNVFPLRVPGDADPRRGPVQLAAIDVASGWLGKNWDKTVGGAQTLDAAPYAAFAGDKAVASWLPTADFARCWQEFCRTGDLPVWW